MVLGIAKRGLGLLGKKKISQPSEVIKNWGHGGSKKPDWEIKANKKEMEDINKKIKIVKKAAGAAGATVAGSAVYGVYRKNKKSKNKKGKE